MIRVLIADDQQLVRDGFAMIVDAQGDMEVVGEAADGELAVKLAGELKPDVALIDIRMPGMDGLEATRRIVHDRPHGPRVLMLTTFDLDEYVYEAMKAGASGFLLKDVPRDQLLNGIRIVAGGEMLLAPVLTQRLVEAFVRRPPPGRATPTALAGLSEREREVLGLIARGRSNAEIGAELFLAASTVKSHVTAILGKLGLRDRVQAVILAYETGLITPGDA